jgi:hypothetical protein
MPPPEPWWWRQYRFECAFTIKPERDEQGVVVPFEIWKTHAKALTGDKLHPHGPGPFCEFDVPRSVSRKPGVYVFRIGGEAMYVGESGKRGLRKRLSEYHRICGRQSFMGGPRTTCYINAQIYLHTVAGAVIHVYTLETNNFLAIERDMIHDLGHPPWNLAWCEICGFKNYPAASGIIPTSA